MSETVVICTICGGTFAGAGPGPDWPHDIEACARNTPTPHRLMQRIEKLEAALRDAIDGWEEAASYKGGYLRNKHRDDEEIARVRAVLESPT